MLVRLFVLVILGMTVFGACASWQCAENPVDIAEIDTVPEEVEEVEEVALAGHVPCTARKPDAVLDPPRAERTVPSLERAGIFRPPRVVGS